MARMFVCQVMWLTSSTWKLKICKYLKVAYNKNKTVFGYNAKQNIQKCEEIEENLVRSGKKYTKKDSN